MNGKSSDTPPKNGDGRQNISLETNIKNHLTPSRRRIVGVCVFALILTLFLFYFHLLVIFDVAGEMLRHKAWLLENMETKDAGKLILLGCFLALVLAHVTQAAVWDFFLRRTQLLPSFTEGVYFAAASITTLGYGDILLRYPWRHVGTLIAITGVLMFGCSTAFLFVVLQEVWHHF